MVRPFDNRSSEPMMLHMIPYQFIWVQIWCIGRQIEKPQMSTCAQNKLLDRCRTMHRMPIYNKEDGTIGLQHEPIEKINKHLSRKLPLRTHEPQFTPGADRRNQ